MPTGIFTQTEEKQNVIFYDYRTNVHHTRKKNPLKLSDLQEFVTCYNPGNRHKRKETFHATNGSEGRWRKFTYEEIIARDKTSLDITWLKVKSLADLDNLPDPMFWRGRNSGEFGECVGEFREVIRQLKNTK